MKWILAFCGIMFILLGVFEVIPEVVAMVGIGVAVLIMLVLAFSELSRRCSRCQCWAKTSLTTGVGICRSFQYCGELGLNDGKIFTQDWYVCKWYEKRVKEAKA